MLEVRNISKAFARRPILQEVGFSLAAGEALGVAGHNGSGKSTLLAIVGQVLPPDQGEILIEGKALGGRGALSPALLGYVPQEVSLLPDLTVKETLDFWQRLYHQPVSDLFAPSSPAALLGLGPIQKQQVAKLSGGMQKRVSIALALLHRPRLLLLDEALSALDRGYRLALEGYLADFCRRGGCLLYCSHEIPELLGLCRRILVLRQGRKVFDGPAADFPSVPELLDGLLNPES